MKKALIIFFMLIALHMVGFINMDEGSELLGSGDVPAVFAADQQMQPSVILQNGPAEDLVSNSNLMILGMAVVMLVLVRGRSTRNY